MFGVKKFQTLAEFGDFLKPGRTVHPIIVASLQQPSVEVHVHLVEQNAEEWPQHLSSRHERMIETRR